MDKALNLLAILSIIFGLIITIKPRWVGKPNLNNPSLVSFCAFFFTIAVGALISQDTWEEKVKLFLGILFFVSIIFCVIGLINPKLVGMPNRNKPILAPFCAFIFSIVVALMTPNSGRDMDKLSIQGKNSIAKQNSESVAKSQSELEGEISKNNAYSTVEIPDTEASPRAKLDDSQSSKSSRYAECKSFCAQKFIECTKYMHDISPEDCANVSNECLNRVCK